MEQNQPLYLQGYRLTTAEIVYHLPDHPMLLQSYVWQEMDLNPHFPELQGFLDFWEHNLDGKLHSVKVAQEENPSRRLRFADVELGTGTLN